MSNGNSNTEEIEVGFYVLHNPNTDQVYAGSGVLKDRQKSHQQLLKNGKHYNHRLQHAYDKDPNFEFVAIPINGCGSSEEDRLAAFEVEQGFINEHWGNRLFLNLARNVEACFAGKVHTDESNAKNREATLSRWKDPVFRDKVTKAQRDGWASLSEVDKLKLSESRSKILKECYATGGRASTAGQTRSAEFCETRSSLIKEKWQDPAYRDKQTAQRVGNTNAPTRSVCVEGVTYSSMTEAAKAHGIGKEKLHYRVQSQSDRFKDWNYIEPLLS